MLVNALSANLDLGVLDKYVTEVVKPAEGSAVRDSNLGDSDLKVYAVHEVTVTRNSACYALAEIGRTVEGLLDGLHREVCVAAVNYLEEGNLRVTGKVNVLGTISY